MILDDFFVSALDGWECEGRAMHRAEDVEAYVRGVAPAGADVRAKLLHCYEQWETPEGFRVQAAPLFRPVVRSVARSVRRSIGRSVGRAVG